MEDGFFTTATAIILAGGDSSEYGSNRSLLDINGSPMIDHIREQLSKIFHKILISANSVETYSFLHLPIIPDSTPGLGPLMGIYSTVDASLSNINFVISSYIPDLNVNFIKEMLNQAVLYDVVVPQFHGNRIEPLFAVYKKDCVHFMHQALRDGKRDVNSFFKDVNVKYMDITGQDWFTKIVTPEDYQNYMKKKFVVSS